VDDELTYVSTPTELSLFQYVHRAIEDIKERLTSDYQNAAPNGNPFLPRFSRGTRIYPKIESLGSSTDLKEWEILAAVTEEQEASLDTLRCRASCGEKTSKDRHSGKYQRGDEECNGIGGCYSEDQAVEHPRGGKRQGET
jgi:hypothetical protein